MYNDLRTQTLSHIALESTKESNTSASEVLPPVLTVAETARLLRLGRSKTYEALRQGVIPHVRVGKLIRVPRDPLLAWLSRGELSGEGMFKRNDQD